MAITSINPNPPTAGQPFSVGYHFARPKTGGVVGIAGPQETGCYGVEPGACDYLYRSGYGVATISGTDGTITLTAPGMPGIYTLYTAYRPDGGTLDLRQFSVVAAAPTVLAPAQDGGGSGGAVVTVAAAPVPAVRPVAGGPALSGLNLSSGLLGLPRPVLIGGVVLLFLILGRR